MNESLRINPDAVKNDILRTADFGMIDTENGIGRTVLPGMPANGRARTYLVDQMIAAGIDVTVDVVGNITGRWTPPAADGTAAPVAAGSHLDSVPKGGIFDGPLGVYAALEAVRTIKDSPLSFNRPIEVVCFTGEEGTRFADGVLGSSVAAGELSVEDALDLSDGRVSLGTALAEAGFRGTGRLDASEWHAWIELHIEQGPYLEADDVDVGIVTGIVGFTWGAITMHGEADHSGPTPMHHRSDALVAAADVITAIRRIPNSLGRRTVGTTGYIDAKPNSINVIPEEVTFTWGFRDTDPAVIEAARERVLDEAELAAEREGVDVEYEDRMWADPVQFADACTEAVGNAADRLGYDSMRLFSGAGHDATHMADLMDTGMVFARSENGKSHNESEFTSWDDCYRAANTFANAAVDLATV